ncbi:unnamed protein product [Malus baccata var. baccata]
MQIGNGSNLKSNKNQYREIHSLISLLWLVRSSTSREVTACAIQQKFRCLLHAPVDISTLAKNARFDFLRSSITQARKYLVETEFFKRDFVQSNVFLLVGNVCLSHPMLLKSTLTRMEMHKDRVLLLFVTIESKDGAYVVLKLTPMLKKCRILAFSHRLGVFRKAYVHCIVFAKFKDDINLLADHMKDLFNSKTGRIGPKSADLGKVKEIFSKVRLVGCFGFPIIEYKGVRVSGLFPGSDGVPIKELLCGNRVAGWAMLVRLCGDCVSVVST